MKSSHRNRVMTVVVIVAALVISVGLRGPTVAAEDPIPLGDPVAANGGPNAGFTPVSA